MPNQTAIPCTIFRGGTSRGPYFLASDLPEEREIQDRILTAAMGSGNEMQINGIGGGHTLTSKVAIVGPSQHPEADVDYLFAQVSVEEFSVDIGPSCGNILSGVGPFAIEKGLVAAQDGETVVRVRNVNTDSLIHVVVKTPGGVIEYEGDTVIDGVPGSGAPVILNFLDVAGTKTGKLLPTGDVRDEIDGIEVSCVDAAVPMVLIPAKSLGKTGAESKAELDADSELLARIEKIRREASLKMGLGDAAGKVIPKVALLSEPRHGGTITSRYFVPHNCHASHAVTGAICVAACIAVPGSVARDVAVCPEGEQKPIRIEHPSGKIDVILEVEGENADNLELKRAGLVRTARLLFSGQIHIPASIWAPGATQPVEV
ncbi:PrpF family isomerase [Marinobacterium zhoushanense]|uniref:PrpF family isomerase n=1 Tax=Marinobacterium zhoushanense TaxID=1679163 RepID=A0ABQ1JVM7_9GAMM|nr:4-oxalomesaconate tautomerase [Marinobacterium zhoushanense]GGB79213.1 PrpF family isomerase [Marinobacterium zhoushanense]